MLKEETKACTKCKEVKPFSMFSRRPDRNSLQSQCKKCQSDYHQEKKKRIASGELVPQKRPGPPIPRKDWDAFYASGVKTCCDCKEEKPFSEFYDDPHKSCRYRVRCIPCDKLYQAACHVKNPEPKRERRRTYYAANILQERVKACLRAKKLREECPEVVAGYKAKAEKKMREDPLYRIKKNLRTMLWRVMAGQTKPEKTFQIIGCTYEEFIEKLNVMLDEEGLVMENYGRRDIEDGWEMDHETPLNTFDFLKNSDDIYKANHYSNLRPYRWRANRKEQYRDADGNVVPGKKKK